MYSNLWYIWKVIQVYVQRCTYTNRHLKFQHWSILTASVSIPVPWIIVCFLVNIRKLKDTENKHEAVADWYQVGELTAFPVAIVTNAAQYAVKLLRRYKTLHQRLAFYVRYFIAFLISSAWQLIVLQKATLSVKMSKIHPLKCVKNGYISMITSKMTETFDFLFKQCFLACSRVHLFTRSLGVVVCRFDCSIPARSGTN